MSFFAVHVSVLPLEVMSTLERTAVFATPDDFRSSIRRRC